MSNWERNLGYPRDIPRPQFIYNIPLAKYTFYDFIRVFKGPLNGAPAIIFSEIGGVINRKPSLSFDFNANRENTSFYDDDDTERDITIQMTVKSERNIILSYKLDTSQLVIMRGSEEYESIPHIPTKEHPNNFMYIPTTIYDIVEYSDTYPRQTLSGYMSGRMDVPNKEAVFKSLRSKCLDLLKQFDLVRELLLKEDYFMNDFNNWIHNVLIPYIWLKGEDL